MKKMWQAQGESSANSSSTKTNDKIQVSTAVAIFHKDLIHSPKDFAQRFFNLQRWTEMKEGGHFAALEKPELLAADIRMFIEELNFTK